MKGIFTARCLLLSLVLLVGLYSNAEAQRQAAPAAAPEVAVIPAEQAAAERADTRRPGLVFRDCPTCPDLVVVPAGTYQMGSDPRDQDSKIGERPQHPVTVDAFALGLYEVTREEYAAFVAATRRTSAACWMPTLDDEDNVQHSYEGSWRDPPGIEQGDGHPVMCVNWEDAQAYVRWLSEQTGQDYRLPSEAEWEYATRAGTTTAYSWGNDTGETCGYANGPDFSLRVHFGFQDGPAAPLFLDCNDRTVWTAPVGSYVPNDFGLYDMHGNVFEWVEDCWHENYRRAPSDGTAWTSGGDCSLRVLRGGSGMAFYPSSLRSANRYWIATGIRYTIFGFRVARTLTP